MHWTQSKIICHTIEVTQLSPAVTGHRQERDSRCLRCGAFPLCCAWVPSRVYDVTGCALPPWHPWGRPTWPPPWLALALCLESPGPRPWASSCSCFSCLPPRLQPQPTGTLPVRRSPLAVMWVGPLQAQVGGGPGGESGESRASDSHGWRPSLPRSFPFSTPPTLPPFTLHVATLVSLQLTPFAILPSACGQRPVQGKILGGVDALERKWPWQVSVHYTGFHICGGSIIDEYWILSAAHCFDRWVGGDGYPSHGGLGLQGQPHGLHRTGTSWSWGENGTQHTAPFTTASYTGLRAPIGPSALPDRCGTK